MRGGVSVASGMVRASVRFRSSSRWTSAALPSAQDVGDGWCVRTSVTLPGLVGGFRGVVVADMADAGRGSGVLGEDLVVEVGDGDLVAGLAAVADDEDLPEGVVDTDLVDHAVDADGAGGVHRSHACAGR